MKQEPERSSDQDISSNGNKPHHKRGRIIHIELPRGGGRRGRVGGEANGEEEDEMMELEKRIEKAGLPEHAFKAAHKELKVLPTLAKFSQIIFNFLVYTEIKKFTGTVSRTCCVQVYMYVFTFNVYGMYVFVCRNYLETLLDLPWSSSTTDSLDLDTARLTLDADHYGLKPV